MCTGGSQKRIDGPHSMKYSIAQKCKEWNTRCRPPKNLHEFEKEIDGWYKWLSIHGISKIGGC